MGNQKTIALKPETLKELAKETDFTENQIKDWYKSFLKNHPSGFCSKHEFKKTYADLFPEGDSGKFSEQIFRTYDKNHDGCIDFREIVCALKLVTHSRLEDKLKWAFDLFDKDGNGSISKSEMKEMLTAIYKMNQDEEDDTNPEKETERIFKIMDKNNDNSISLEEFMEGVRVDQTTNPSLSRLCKVIGLIIA